MRLFDETIQVSTAQRSMRPYRRFVGVRAHVRMIVDANGRRVGFDPTTGTIIKEIPSSFYDENQVANDTGSGDTTGVSHIIGIRQPAAGQYQIVVTGLANWPYRLSVSPFSQDGNSEGILRFSGIAGAGSTTTYQIEYASQVGATSIAVLAGTFQSTLSDISNYQPVGQVRLSNAAHGTGTVDRQTTEAEKEAIKNEKTK